MYYEFSIVMAKLELFEFDILQQQEILLLSKSIINIIVAAENLFIFFK